MRFGLIVYPQKPLIIAHSGVSRGTRCLNVVRSLLQLAYLVLNPITVYSYGFLFNCTTVGQASDSMTALT